MKMNNEWRNIRGYNGDYKVNSSGEIFSTKTMVTLSPYLGKDGYMRAVLYKNKRRTVRYVHRVVAEAFLKKKKGFSEVNHKNGNKADNSVDNLEWTTRSQNIKHAIYSLKRKIGRRPQAIRCVETNELFESQMSAAREKNVSQSLISESLHNRNRTAGGYHWELL